MLLGNNLQVHGILNIVGWGIFLPIGVIVIRYCKVRPFKAKSWYALHVSCQIVGYILGTAGWIIGLCLGKVSTHYSFHTHRILAIFIFSFTTLQVIIINSPITLIVCSYFDHVNRFDPIYVTDASVAVQAKTKRRVQEILEHVPSFSGICFACCDLNQYIPWDFNSEARSPHLEMVLHWSSRSSWFDYFVF